MPGSIFQNVLILTLGGYNFSIIDILDFMALDKIRERGQWVVIPVAACTSSLTLVIFQMLGLRFYYLIFCGVLTNMLCLIVTSIVTTLYLSFGVCDVTNSIVTNISRSWNNVFFFIWRM